MANNIREAPIPDISVKGSPNKKMEIAIAVITSISRMTVEWQEKCVSVLLSTNNKGPPNKMPLCI
jgi:hypothetical protein